jgi:sugar lactone lactonase YvrE
MKPGFSPALLSRLRVAVSAVFALAALGGLQGQTNTYTFGTLAGAAPGSADGSGTNARFRGGGGIAVDSAGNFYVADAGNNTIRKITAAGAVTTLAGSPGQSGTRDGTGTDARFNGPAAVAVDGAGNLYVADYGNNTIRRVTPTGAVTTLAGSPGNPGPSGDSADGIGAAAGFFHPNGLAVDGSGNVYVADAGNGTIRKITPAGSVTTLAGVVGVAGTTDGTGTAALFDYPNGVAIGGDGNLYVTDHGANTIRKITPGGAVTTLAGAPGVSGSTDGTGAAARFFELIGVAIDSSGNLYVADNGNNTIRKVTPAGAVTTLAGSPTVTGSTDGEGAAASFFDPYGVAVDPSGNVLATDDTCIRKITPGGSVTTFAGVESSGSSDGLGAAARFLSPFGVAVDASGNAYVADNGNDTIRKVTPAGAVTTLAGSAGQSGNADGTGPAARFNRPAGVAVDGAGNLFVADDGNDTIRKITLSGVVTTFAGTAGISGSSDGTGSASRFRTPYGLAADGSGNLYVADAGNYTIRKVTPSGVVSTFAGTAGVPGNSDGSGSAAMFTGPGGVAADASGNLYVTDGNTIRKITSAGTVTTLAGTPNVFGSADGAGSAASFEGPLGVAADRLGNVFVADSGNNTIREVTPAGTVTTIAGVAGVMGSTDGTGSTALFADPNGVAVDGNGNVYVADLGNNALRLGTRAAPPSVDTGNAWLSNLSARAFLPEGNSPLIAGFVTTGAGSKLLLVRADGPALAGSGVSNFLADPQLTLFSGSAAIAETESWSENLASVFSQVGAFALSPGSHDDALLQSVAPGAYTAQVVSQAGNSGVVLAEIYDADTGAPANRLVNISARAQVGAGANILIGGFAVEGTTDETLLIRAVGPALTPLGVAGALGEPVLTLRNSDGAVIAANTGWGNQVVAGSGADSTGPTATVLQSATSTVFLQAGAFALPPGSADSAMIVSLPPGTYTAQVSGANGTTGVALVEIYEIHL